VRVTFVIERGKGGLSSSPMAATSAIAARDDSTESRRYRYWATGLTDSLKALRRALEPPTVPTLPAQPSVLRGRRHQP
jgi:hypothetical protein